MALYKETKYVTQSDDEAFDKEYKPGENILPSAYLRFQKLSREATQQSKLSFLMR
jgi:hypothetical protein